jgi:hypothetical protein
MLRRKVKATLPERQDFRTLRLSCLSGRNSSDDRYPQVADL